MKLGQRTAPPATTEHHEAGSSRPVLLTTFDTPIVPDAASIAVQMAVEAGRPLLVVNLIGGSFYPSSVAAPAPTPVVTPEVEESLRGPAELAASLGIPTERLRVLSPRPIEALLELIDERRPGLLVLGFDPGRLRRRFRTKLGRSIEEHTSCLVWAAPEAGA